MGYVWSGFFLLHSAADELPERWSTLGPDYRSSDGHVMRASMEGRSLSRLRSRMEDDRSRRLKIDLFEWERCDESARGLL